MNCDEVRELLPAYVLGALDAGDLEAVESHLRQGREHDNELVELRATVFALDRFADEAVLDSSFGTVRERIDRSSAADSVVRRPLWQLTIAAVVLLAVFGAGWLAAALIGTGDDEAISIVIQGSGGEQVALRGADSRELVSVTMAGFARLPEAQAYQLWAIRDGEWLRIGVCNTNPQGGWNGDFEFAIRPGEQIAITIEPAGGSDTPTSEAILTTSF